MTTSAGILLAGADSWARDVLLDVHNNTHSAGGLLAGWADVMRAAAAAWQAIPSQDTPRAPFEHAALTAAQIVNNQPGQPTRPDSRTHRIAALLDSLADAQRADGDTVGPGHEVLRTGILHVGYVLTHAVAISTTRHETGNGGPAWRAHHRIRGIEQLLDAHLHHEPHQSAAIGAPAEVAQALHQWLRVAYNTGQPPNPMMQLILADTTRTLLGNTARLVIHTFQHQQPGRLDAQERLLPAIRNAVEGWEDSRSLWAVLITPTTRQLPEVVSAATRLQNALRQPELIGHPASRTVITSALVAAAEVAIINQQALTHPELTAPRSTVTRMTSEILEREPAGHSAFETWMTIGRREGSMLAQLPAIVRTDLANRGHATLQASLAARSASHILTQPRTLPPDATLHTARQADRTPKNTQRTTPTRNNRRPPGVSP